MIKKRQVLENYYKHFRHYGFFKKAISSPNINSNSPQIFFTCEESQIEKQMRKIYLLRAISNRSNLFASKMTLLEQKLLFSLKNRNAHAPQLKIERIDFSEIDTKNLFKRFFTNPSPFVIKNFPFDRKNWQFSSLLKSYGDTPILITNPELRWHEGRLDELIKPNNYAHNCMQVLKRAPELLDSIDFSLLEGWMHSSQSHQYQMFISSHIGNGSAFHAANNFNFFFQMEGQKKWTFVDPNYSFLIYPFHKSSGFVSLSKVLGKNIDERFPLYQFCPRAEIILNEGDMLFNPPWWWHSVENITKPTVGLATRWWPPKELYQTTNILAECSDHIKIQPLTSQLSGFSKKSKWEAFEKQAHMQSQDF